MFKLIAVFDWTSGGDSSVVERRASDRKVADPWFDFRTGFRAYLPSGGQAVYSLWWPSLTEDLRTDSGFSALVWSDMRTRTIERLDTGPVIFYKYEYKSNVQPQLHLPFTKFLLY